MANFIKSTKIDPVYPKESFCVYFIDNAASIASARNVTRKSITNDI